MNVRTWLAVSVYVVIAQVFVALKNRTRPHTGERRFKCGHNKEHTLYVWTAGLRAFDLVVRRVRDHDLVDRLVGVRALPLVGADALAQVLGDLLGAGDEARVGEDLCRS